MKKSNNKSKQGIVFCKSPLEYKIFDLRASKPSYYKKDEDHGFVMLELEEIKFNGSNELEYFAPNNVGILLSITSKYLTQAEILFKEYIDPDRINHSLNKVNDDRKEFLIKRSKIIYDYIETIQTALVFSYTAIEAFVNLSIPENYEFKQKNENKGIIEVYNKDAIERWVPLKQKISKILVEIYETNDITKKSFWPHFIKLEDYRHSIIHQKSIERVEFYKTYFNKQIFKNCFCTIDIIKFFFNNGKSRNITENLWPWLINEKNSFPTYKYDPNKFEVTGSIYDE